MNKNWSEKNKLLQVQLRKEETYLDGIDTLLNLRNEIIKEVYHLKNELSKEEFSSMPFMNAKGYHSKTIAYSLWHISRIEDIVSNTLIQGKEQIFFTKNVQSRMNSPIITTGNELEKEEIAQFSKQLNLDVLYEYFIEVKENTDAFLKTLSYEDLKRTFSDEDRKNIQKLQVVSEEESAIWLIDYWCNKNIKGLLQMPFSRHWIMHVEAALRIANKICHK